MDEHNAIPVERTGPPPLLRIGVVGVAAAALIAVGILAAATTAAPNGTLAADTGTTTTSNPPAAFGGFGMGGGMRGGVGGRGVGAAITITTISGSNLVLATADGWTRTITVTGSTTYSERGSAITLADLKAGDEIRFSETRQTDGTYSIDSIAVIPPHLGGTISAISGSTITLKQQDGSSATVNVTSTTTYGVGGTTGAKLTDLKTGMVLMATGTRNTDGSLTATSVRAFDPSTMPAHGDGGFHHGMPDSGPNAGAAPSATGSPSATAG